MCLICEITEQVPSGPIIEATLWGAFTVHVNIDLCKSHDLILWKHGEEFILKQFPQLVGRITDELKTKKRKILKNKKVWRYAG